jgi:FAD/FMN-containing dehydrogenase
MKKITKTKWVGVTLFALLLVFLYLSTFVISYDAFFENKKIGLFSDVARIEPEKVVLVDSAKTTEQLIQIIQNAKEKGLKVSMAGSRHSQGGHTYYKDNVVIDMRGYNKVLSVDKDKKQMVVQAGAKWSQVQEELNPYGLSVKVMQSSNLFTIGGTLSANAHGRDLEMSSVIETVQSFRLLTAEGKVINVSRIENPELFSAVIGGYGLFGIILDVTLSVTDNAFYIQRSELISYKDLPMYFEKNIKNKEGVRMMLARPSIDIDTFIDELVVSTWSVASSTPTEEQTSLTKETNVMRDKFFFGLSRKFDWAKDLRWYLQKKVELAIDGEKYMTRNNSMRPPLAPLEFLEYYSKEDTDILQEYFIPISQYNQFIEEFKEILQKDMTNVISFTIRYVKANNEAMLSYCPKEDCFAVIFMANVGLDNGSQEKTKKTIQDMVDKAIENKGTYYLTYQLYPTSQQLRKAYPKFDEFIKLKKKIDPQELFVNKFYKAYEK